MTSSTQNDGRGGTDGPSRLPRAWLDAALVGCFLPLLALVPVLTAGGRSLTAAGSRSGLLLALITVAAVVALPCLGAYLAEALQNPGLSATARKWWATALFLAAPFSTAAYWWVHVRRRPDPPAGSRDH